eukprot:12300943-Prorocentrum_lima.AAC.1
MEDREISRLFQRGGVFAYAEGLLDLTGIQHAIYRRGLYFQEHEQEEALRISAEYVGFSRGHGEA